MPLIRKPKSNVTTQNAPIDVREGLRSENKDERWTAARAAVDPENADALATALQVERDVGVREAMFTSLARIGSPASINRIITFIRSEDAALRAGALDALRGKVDAIRAHLPVLLTDADSDVRILSCELARSLPNHEATQILAELLARENEPNVCAAAIDVLAEAGGCDALAALTACEAKFKDTPFLAFAIQIAKDRIQKQSANQHG